VVETSVGSICLAGDEVPLCINALFPALNCVDRSATAAFLRRARASEWIIVPSHDPYLRHLGSLTPRPETPRQSERWTE
jgi:hypothetical protein